MSELKLVSPLLDGFVIGDPVSDRDGVRCCPAMKENSDDKYIVKIISIPASQKQLDALLLTGAYQDAGAAAEYFKELAEETVKEARLLQQLAKLEGFLSYEGWQIVPKEGSDLGYDVYLLGSYKRSLDKFLRRNAMSHLSAVNLGIDLCTALSLCRRAGFLYTNLKPANIFISGQREYRIGDLGFSRLSAMKYTSLPGKCVSRYTPPELHDPLATLNPTVDTYAVGMILYQIYNNGELPFKTKAPLMILPAPLNADYEMAEIILKACDPNPRKRYQTPVEMGQALVSYMQRNSVNDTPIVPPTVESVSAELAANAARSADQTAAPETAVPSAEAVETDPAAASDELHFMDGLVSDDTAPGAEEGDDLLEARTSDEVDSILAQADQLISHEPDIYDEPEEAEESAVAPETSLPEENGALPGEEPAAALCTEENEAAADEEADDFSLDSEDFSMDDDSEFGLSSDFSDDESLSASEDSGRLPGAVATPRKKKRGWIGIVITLLILALLGGAGYYYFEHYYLLPIENMEITGHEDTITVALTTGVDESLLKIVCTDTYGNKKEQPLAGGMAQFTDLSSNMLYKITVEAEGFHRLTGAYSGNFTTAEVTNVIDFSAKIGPRDGSVDLSFTVDGPETQDWTVEYSTEGEEPKSVSFTGHMVTIDALTVGKVYTFTLVPSADLYLAGTTSLDYLASKIIVAEDLSIVSCQNGVLTARWSVPEDAAVESWSVRCYSGNDYDVTVTVTEPSVRFENISAENGYTLEVTADGMPQSARAFVTANPANITDVQISHEQKTGLTISWAADRNPEGGWLVMYSVDGSETTELAECTGTTAVIKAPIPKTAYSFQIMAADSSTVFGGNVAYEGFEAQAFNQHGLSADKIQFSLCRTPDKENWTHEDVKNSDYTTSYTVNERASLVLYTPAKFYINDTETSIMFIIRNEAGKVLPNCTSTTTRTWRNMWPGNMRYCYLDIPVMPAADGKYTLEVYFDGGLVLTRNFSMITSNG